jgi:hypothetical protein
VLEALRPRSFELVRTYALVGNRPAAVADGVEARPFLTDS